MWMRQRWSWGVCSKSTLGLCDTSRHVESVCWWNRHPSCWRFRHILCHDCQQMTTCWSAWCPWHWETLSIQICLRSVHVLFLCVRGTFLCRCLSRFSHPHILDIRETGNWRRREQVRALSHIFKMPNHRPNSDQRFSSGSTKSWTKTISTNYYKDKWLIFMRFTSGKRKKLVMKKIQNKLILIITFQYKTLNICWTRI